MINLQTQSGLPLGIDENYQLIFHDPLPAVTPTIRKFSEMIPVLMEPEVKPIPETTDMYYMYRDIHLPGDEQSIRNNNVRYDITVAPPLMLGQEYNKVLGHYHAANNKGYIYPEIYEVLHGEAMFLFQNMTEGFKDLITVVASKVTTGEKIIIPPGYGHILINLGFDVLVMANWDADNFKSNYEPVKEKHGMAYYVVRNSQRGFDFVKNPNYNNHPEVRLINDQQRVYANFGFKPDEPMYTAGVANPKLLEFLNAPEKYLAPLSSLIS
jgi:glucose-6-phosphate isomerase